MTGWFDPGEPIIDVIWHPANTAGITAWTPIPFHEGGYRPDIGVTFTDLTGGFYQTAFTPDAEGLWVLAIYETAAPLVHYSTSYLVRSVADLLGGEGYDPASHSLQQIRSSVQIVRDDQLTARNEQVYLPGIGYKKALR